MHQAGTRLGGSLCQVAGADGVCLVGGVVVHLAAIHVGVGGAVDDDVRALAADEIIHHLVVGNVQLGQVHRNDRCIEQLFSGMGPISLRPSRSCLMISVPSWPLQPVTMIFMG